MTTKSKRWPNNADWARLDSISQARRERLALLKEMERVTDPVILLRMAKAADAFHDIESRLLACKSEEPEE